LTLIAPGLYLGNVGSSWDVATLNRHGITSLLTMLNNPEPELWRRWDHLPNREAVPRGSHMFVYTRDEPDFDNLKDMKNMLDWIDGQLVLAGHCPSELSEGVVKMALKIAAGRSTPLQPSMQAFLDALASAHNCPAPKCSENSMDRADRPLYLHVNLWGPWAGFVAPEGYEAAHFEAAHVLAETSVALAGVEGATTTTTETNEVADLMTDLTLNNENKQSHVLVHCKAGMSRSASAIVCWLMRRDGFHRSVPDILQELCGMRGKVNLNPTFREALDVFHKRRGHVYMDHEGQKPSEEYAKHLEYIATPHCKDNYYLWRTAWSGEPLPKGYPFAKN
jgi:hypothetical protein